MNKHDLIQQEKNYILQTYVRPEIVFERGEGAVLYDSDGRAYLDFNAGIAVSALGHADPDWAKAVAEQASKLTHTSNLYHTAPQIGLAKKLVESSFADKVYFCNSGTEANEAALKFARKYAWNKYGQGTGDEGLGNPKTKIIAFSHSFHGRTMGSLATTAKEKYRKPFEPLINGVIFAEFNDLASVKAVMDDSVGAVILEPVQGEGGIYPATADFLHGLRALCDQYDALLIFDEIQCGLGRTGYLWAHEAMGVVPDIMTIAKPLAGGLPIGATLVSQKVANALQPGDHGTTFGGGPLVCTAANVVFDKVSQPDFLAHVRAMGEHLHHRLHEMLPADQVVAIRGRGLMMGVELNRPVAEITKACVANGVLVIGAGDMVLRLVPPLIINEEQIDHAVAVLQKVLSAQS